MRYVCDASERLAWFRLETEGEAVSESVETHAGVAYFFREARRTALLSYRPRADLSFFERDIGLEAHIQRAMPLFLTLRDRDGTALVTAMLPPAGKDSGSHSIFVWGAGGVDPYESHALALQVLETKFDLSIIDRMDDGHCLCLV